MYYVTMTDRFRSGWGRASGSTNKLIFECETWTEAQTVAQNARNRSDQKYINVCTTRPNYYRVNEDRSGYHCGPYYVQIKDRAEYPRWYEQGAF